MAPKIILAIVTPLLSLTSIRIGFGLELSIAEPVVSEVLKWNPITVYTQYREIGEDFTCIVLKKFIGRSFIIISPPFILKEEREKKKEEEKEGTKNLRPYTKLPNCCPNTYAYLIITPEIHKLHR